MEKKYYKFLDLKEGVITSRCGAHTWEVGKTYSVKGTVKRCVNGFHAAPEPLDALRYVRGDVLALVEAAGDCDNRGDQVCYRSMSIVAAYRWTRLDSVALAVYAAERVIGVFEDEYPDDPRPREAINAARAYLKNPSEANADKARAAADAADAAADAADAAVNAAVNAAYAAAKVAADAAYAAAYAADAAAYDARAAAYATARAAYDAARPETEAEINRWIKNRITTLERIGPAATTAPRNGGAE